MATVYSVSASGYGAHDSIPDYDTASLDVPVAPARPNLQVVPPPVEIRDVGYRFYLVLALLIASIFTQVFFHSTARSYAMDTAAKQAEIVQVRNESTRMQVRNAARFTPQALEAAAQSLGMVVPNQVTVLTVNLDKYAPATGGASVAAPSQLGAASVVVGQANTPLTPVLANPDLRHGTGDTVTSTPQGAIVGQGDGGRLAQPMAQPLAQPPVQGVATSQGQPMGQGGSETQPGESQGQGGVSVSVPDHG